MHRGAWRATIHGGCRVRQQLNTHSPQGHRVGHDRATEQQYLRTEISEASKSSTQKDGNPQKCKTWPHFLPQENFTDPSSQRKQWGQLTREPGGQSQVSTGADTAGSCRRPSGCYSQGPDFSGFYFYQEQTLYLDSTRRSGRNSSACKETPIKTSLSFFSAFCIFFFVEQLYLNIITDDFELWC